MIKKLFIPLLFLACSVSAKPRVFVQVDPSTVKNGENVVYTIIVENQGAIQLQSPVTPQMVDWQIVNSSQASNVTSQMINGSISSKYEFTFTYVLRPLKTGKLKIPPFQVRLGRENRMTVPVDIQVDAISQNSPDPMLSDEEAFGLPGLPNNFGNLNDFDLPERESFFIRGEPSKTNVYDGELVVLSFVLYQKDVDLSNAELDRFPDFKGFLKEDLYIPKNWTRQQVILKGEPYFRTELLRYAIFTLKPGVSKIGQMVFRADARTSMSSIIGGLMTGKIPPNMGGGVIPTTKYSPEIQITSKPLPPTTLKSFTGGVGKFTGSIKGPQGVLSENSPFTIELRIEGRGNLKTIEAPQLALPESFEMVDTKNLYKFNPNATGYKTFEYLVLPKNAGKFTLGTTEFSYFDPETAKYETLKLDPLDLDIKEGAKNTQPESADVKEKEPSFGSVRSGPQVFKRISEKDPGSFLVHPAFLFFQCFLYVGSFVWLVVRKRYRLRQSYLNLNPWERTFEKIASKKTWPLFELADLADQWMRERLVGLLKSPGLYSESHYDEIVAALSSRIHPEKQDVLNELRNFWSDLDLLRFSGSQRQNEKTKYKPLMEKAKNLYQKIESVCSVGN